MYSLLEKLAVRRLQLRFTMFSDPGGTPERKHRLAFDEHPTATMEVRK